MEEATLLRGNKLRQEELVAELRVGSDLRTGSIWEGDSTGLEIGESPQAKDKRGDKMAELGGWQTTLQGERVIIVEGEEETAGTSSRTEMAGAQVRVKQEATSLPDMRSARPTTANYSMTQSPSLGTCAPLTAVLGLWPARPPTTPLSCSRGCTATPDTPAAGKHQGDCVEGTIRAPNTVPFTDEHQATAPTTGTHQFSWETGALLSPEAADHRQHRPAIAGVKAGGMRIVQKHQGAGEQNQEKDKDSKEYESSREGGHTSPLREFQRDIGAMALTLRMQSPPKPTLVISGAVTKGDKDFPPAAAQGDKDFPPAAAQVAHQKPQPSVEKLPSAHQINQHIHQPRK
ncbi:UNVERIFIED_CONTAM: hypothetical protein FKN15_030510 [Acipenser sinensis]